MVSVIIPAFNSHATISRAVKSVLRQTECELEIIVVDDGSSDSTADVVRGIGDKRVRYIYQMNGGPASARNRGIAAAKGEFLAFLDADDEWLPEKLEEQLSFMRVKHLDVSVTDVLEFRGGVFSRRCEKDWPASGAKEDVVRAIYLGRILMNTPTLVAKRSLVESVGGFREELKNREDHFLLCQLVEQGKAGLLRKALVKRFVLPTGYSASFDPVDYFKDTLPFHEICGRTFPFLDVAKGIRQTKWIALKKALLQHNPYAIIRLMTLSHHFGRN